VSIGARTNIQDGSVLHVTHKSSITRKAIPHHWRRCYRWP
jgi:carbonic anhydrase/acetyltransferase-like protein (isoleucine patch superfamily)